MVPLDTKVHYPIIQVTTHNFSNDNGDLVIQKNASSKLEVLTTGVAYIPDAVIGS